MARVGQQAGTAGRPPSRIGVWIKTARPFSLSASVSPILVGTALAAYDGRFDAALFAATLLASVMLQVAANYFNILGPGVHCLQAWGGMARLHRY